MPETKLILKPGEIRRRRDGCLGNLELVAKLVGGFLGATADGGDDACIGPGHAGGKCLGDRARAKDAPCQFSLIMISTLKKWCVSIRTD